MNQDDLYGAELLAALQTLDPDAAPLVAALVVHGCLTVPAAMQAPLLTLLESIATEPYCTEFTGLFSMQQLAVVAAWRGAQGRDAGDVVSVSPAWLILRDLGCEDAARAAVTFAVHLASLTVAHVMGEAAPTIH